jgi:hypothetical protein
MSQVRIRARGKAAPATFEQRWATASLRASEAAAAGKTQLAESYYLELLKLARVALGLARHDGSARLDETMDNWLRIWVTSHLDFADFLAAGGNFENALSVAFEAFEELVTCLHDTHAPAGLHRACLLQLKASIDGLSSLLDRAGLPQAHKDRVLAKAQSLALGYWDVWT